MSRYDDRRDDYDRRDDRRRDDRRDERPRGPPNTEGMHSIKIDNLAYETSSNYLRKYGHFN